MEFKYTKYTYNNNNNQDILKDNNLTDKEKENIIFILNFFKRNGIKKKDDFYVEFSHNLFKDDDSYDAVIFLKNKKNNKNIFLLFEFKDYTNSFVNKTYEALYKVMNKTIKLFSNFNKNNSEFYLIFVSKNNLKYNDFFYKYHKRNLILKEKEEIIKILNSEEYYNHDMNEIRCELITTQRTIRNIINLDDDNSIDFTSVDSIIKKIKSNKVVMITGEAGSGKTVIATRLFLKLKGFEKKYLLIINQYMVKELKKALNKQKKMIFDSFKALDYCNNFNSNNSILIIDESQRLGITDIEKVRIFLEKPNNKIVFIGDDNQAFYKKYDYGMINIEKEIENNGWNIKKIELKETRRFNKDYLNFIKYFISIFSKHLNWEKSENNIIHFKNIYHSIKNKLNINHTNSNKIDIYFKNTSFTLSIYSNEKEFFKKYYSSNLNDVFLSKTTKNKKIYKYYDSIYSSLYIDKCDELKKENIFCLENKKNNIFDTFHTISRESDETFVILEKSDLMDHHDCFLYKEIYILLTRSVNKLNILINSNELFDEIKKKLKLT